MTKHTQQLEKKRACRVCGCTEHNPCQPLGCWWVDQDLCSKCVDKPDPKRKAA